MNFGWSPMFKAAKKSSCYDAQQCRALFLESCLQHCKKPLNFLYVPWGEGTPLQFSVRFMPGYCPATRKCWSKKQHFKSASYTYYCDREDSARLDIPASEISALFCFLNYPFRRWTGATSFLRDLSHYSRCLQNCNTMSLQQMQSPCFLESPFT